MKKNNTSFFTLIELAAVIVIVVIIAGISITAFFKMTKGKNVDYAAKVLAAKLESVRSYAITNNTYAALVFPTTQSINSDYLYKSYRACKVTSANVFDGWLADNKWEFMPSGSAVVLPITNYDTTTDVTFHVVGSDDTTANAMSVVFSPSGGTYSGTTKQITIGEYTYITTGSVGSDTIVITVDKNTGRISY